MLLLLWAKMGATPGFKQASDSTGPSLLKDTLTAGGEQAVEPGRATESMAGPEQEHEGQPGLAVASNAVTWCDFGPFVFNFDFHTLQGMP